MKFLYCQSVTLTVALVISLAHGEVTHCSPSHTQPKLSFVAQLSINGCPVFVHDTGAKDGPHLALQPLMCVTQSLHKVLPRYDPITEQTYVSVPVMLRDDAMLTEVEHQLRHLSPKSVKFATVSDISVSTNTFRFREMQVLDFIYSAEESVGYMKLGCSLNSKTCAAWKILNIVLRDSRMEIVNQVMATANVELNGTQVELKYHMMLQNSGYFRPDIYRSNFLCFANCSNLRFIRFVLIHNCTARVHEKLDMKGHFLIEPLLCHNITSLINESITYDYSREMYSLKLDVVLQDEIILDAVRSKLAHLSPLNVTFMRLWRVENVVASVLSRGLEIGGLMVSGDWKSGQMRVYCRMYTGCRWLRHELLIEPVTFWQHIKVYATSLLEGTCVFKSKKAAYYIRLKQSSGKTLSDRKNIDNIGYTRSGVKVMQGRSFIIIYQRLTTDYVSFQPSWDEYETGFGDKADFWIGLSTIHSLSINGSTLRVEMKLWNGTELHAEYAGFKVGDASTNYTMTYRERIRDRSSFSFIALERNNGADFSKMGRDYDGSSESCLNFCGGDGGLCKECHLNWSSRSARLPCCEFRLMLQI